MTHRKLLILMAVLAIGMSAASYGRAQDSQSPQPSLADAARKAREQQKSEPKSAKVYTDDDLESLKGQISIVGTAPAPAAPNDSSNAAQTAKPAAAPGVKGEAYWRKVFADARRALADDQREADVLQREYGLKQVQFYSNPNVALREQYSRKDLDDTLAELNAKKADVDKDNQAINDLHDELRQSGGDAGWADAPTSNAPSDSASSASDSSPAPSPESNPPAEQNPPSGSAVPAAQPSDSGGAPTASQPQ